MNSKQKKALRSIIIILIAIVLIVAGVLIYQNNMDEKERENTDETLSQANNHTLYYDGEAYVYNTNLTNILFLGIDKDAEITLEDSIGEGGQADCIMVLSLDKENETARILQISRNAMTEVDLYDKNGNYYTTLKAQLATQYAYGNGADTSCWATKRTVSELLGDLQISGYFAIDIAAVSVVNDMLGGVTLTIPEDYTEIDPAFVEGVTITLDGEQAERYVRYRDLDMIGSDNLRMQRQAQYIPALLEAIRDAAGGSESELEKMYDSISAYTVTDLTVEEMADMLSADWDMDSVISVPGESIKGDEFEEFYVNEDELQKILVEMFYKSK